MITLPNEKQDPTETQIEALSIDTETCIPKKKRRVGIPKGYYGIQGMCELFGKSEREIYRMIADERLPKPFKDGRLNVWCKKEIDNWHRQGKFLTG